MFQDRTETSVTVNILTTGTHRSILSETFDGGELTYLDGAFIVGTVLGLDLSGGQFVWFRGRLVVGRTISLTQKGQYHT